MADFTVTITTPSPGITFGSGSKQHIVRNITTGSLAAKLGVGAGDVLLMMNGLDLTYPLQMIESGQFGFTSIQCLFNSQQIPFTATFQRNGFDPDPGAEPEPMASTEAGSEDFADIADIADIIATTELTSIDIISAFEFTPTLHCPISSTSTTSMCSSRSSLDPFRVNVSAKRAHSSSLDLISLVDDEAVNKKGHSLSVGHTLTDCPSLDDWIEDELVVRHSEHSEHSDGHRTDRSERSEPGLSPHESQEALLGLDDGHSSFHSTHSLNASTTPTCSYSLCSASPSSDSPYAVCSAKKKKTKRVVFEDPPPRHRSRWSSDGPLIRRHIRQRIRGADEVHFDRISKTHSNGKIVTVSKGFRSGYHEWTIKILRCDIDFQEIGVVSNPKIKAFSIADGGLKDTVHCGSKALYGSEMSSDSAYYGTWNEDGKPRCFRDLSQVMNRRWCTGDVVRVCLDLDRWRIRFLFNGQKVRRMMSLEKGKSYHPVISFAGNCHYKLLL